MNRFSGFVTAACLFVCAACGAPASEVQGADEGVYRVRYTAIPDPAGTNLTVELRVEQQKWLLREMQFDVSARYSAFESDGEFRIDDGRAVWLPPRPGGRLRWAVHIDQRRDDGGYDAMLNAEWGVFRAEDIIPRAKTRTRKAARSETTLTFELPEHWSVQTEYSSLRDPIPVTRPGRRFSQPTGWIAVGKLGIRRETIAGIRVAVAGPQGQSIRRMDMIALLNWTLPELSRIVANPPERLTIISADDPMWRGGLSGPASLFLHSERPLISENATSTLLHEIMHVALSIEAATGYDWISEGLAEYYSLELLHRGGAITSRRYETALADQLQWARDAKELCAPRSTGATTALAVTRFRELDEQLQRATGGAASLDTLIAALIDTNREIDLDRLRGAATAIAGKRPQALDVDNLPGCHNISADEH